MRVIGLDYGTKTVGVALSDALGITAQPVETITRKDVYKRQMWSGDMVASFAKKYLGCDKEYVRPDGLLLGYPVITSGKDAHRASFVKLLGENYEKYIDDISLENKVSKDTPESFIWHTFDDNSVPLENTLLLVEALRKNNVKFEYHVFPDGCQGLGLGTKETTTKGGKHYQPEVYAWTSLFKQWMDRYDK